MLKHILSVFVLISGLGILPAQAQDKASVEGFRSAKFGMDEAAVRKAATTDFGKAAAAITVETNQLEKTKVLSLNADDLVPGTGPGRVSYTFGFTSQKLMQVSIAWIGKQANDQENTRLRNIAAALQAYFTQQGYVKDSVMLEGTLQDGTQVGFRGLDEKGRMTLLRYSIGRTDDKGKQDLPVVVLTYTENPKNPDIFRIKPGSF